MFIPGIVIFLVESGQVKELRSRSRIGSLRDGQVKSVKHVTKNDKFDRQVFDYYETTVESEDPRTGKKERHTIKSPVKYPLNQSVRLHFQRGSSEPSITDGVSEHLIHPWLGLIGGALLILLALFQIQGKEISAMVCLSLILIGAGAGMIANYVSIKKKNLVHIEAEVKDIFERQISKPGRFSGGSKFTYYPVVTYELDGTEMMRMCNVNSSRKDSFKIGEKMDLYYSPSEGAVRERKASTAILIIGIIVLILGVLAGVSIISALA